MRILKLNYAPGLLTYIRAPSHGNPTRIIYESIYHRCTNDLVIQRIEYPCSESNNIIMAFPFRGYKI